jgi:hypothetical protein
MICGNCLFGVRWLKVHTHCIYCIRNFIKFMTMLLCLPPNWGYVVRTK